MSNRVSPLVLGFTLLALNASANPGSPELNQRTPEAVALTPRGESLEKTFCGGPWKEPACADLKTSYYSLQETPVPGQNLNEMKLPIKDVPKSILRLFSVIPEDATHAVGIAVKIRASELRLIYLMDSDSIVRNRGWTTWDTRNNPRFPDFIWKK